MNKLTFTSGHMAYLLNSLLPGLISLGILLSGLSAIFIYLAFLICHLATAAFYKNRGVSARFNVAQSTLISLIAAAALIMEYCLLCSPTRTLVQALEMAFKLQASGFMEWALAVSFFAVVIMYYVINFICWKNSRNRVFPLAVIGRWAWQSAILDDTSGEYAPLDEAMDK